jgi:uncharacterized protein Yka (UPF0111/DUF47 family)
MSKKMSKKELRERLPKFMEGLEELQKMIDGACAVLEEKEAEILDLENRKDELQQDIEERYKRLEE